MLKKTLGLENSAAVTCDVTSCLSSHHASVSPSVKDFSENAGCRESLHNFIG